MAGILTHKSHVMKKIWTTLDSIALRSPKLFGIGEGGKHGIVVDLFRRESHDALPNIGFFN